MLSARVISRGFSVGNFAVKRCMKRPQGASHIVNNSDQEMNSDEVTSSEHRPLKKIKSHVYYSKKQTRQMCTDKKSESDEMEAQCSSPKCRSQSKIKSSSWKRSDKRGSYVKPWRKKSSNWMTLQPTKQRSEFCSSGRLSSSACRPGTLYSDVVFGGRSTPLNDAPLILFQRQESATTSPLSSGGGANSKVRRKTHKRIIPRSRSITLERLSKDAEIDEAFPPLLSSTKTPKCSGKSRGTLRLKQRKPMKHTLKADHLIVNLNTANKANIFFFGQEQEFQSSKSEDQEISECSQEVERIVTGSEELTTIGERLQAVDMESSANSTFKAETSINQIAYGLYLKNQFHTCRNDIIHFIETPSEHLKMSEDEDDWKYKYLPIMNVKLFEDSDDEYGFGYSGYNVPKRSFLEYENGEQTFPRFSKHFDDDSYLCLERKAINSLESALSSSNI